MGLADITPERVRAAYLRRGWKPRRSRLGDCEAKCGCAAGVLVGFPTWEERIKHENTDIARMLGVSLWELTDLMSGFDGLSGPGNPSPARLLGRACWEAVKDLAVKEVGV